ncbi:glycosyltransferase family 2 protein [Acinetobacter sp. NIPH 2377]|uniref:glycosyltransferase family 2 protein n=1 Tax=Acinetobacter terrestris TaxID=2529843 RepID=UPI00148F82EC|nr:glycosyltransferase family 2 protein [Acinetobacter terrestris]NNH34574.1 glycosyltransferase family 2 protein [Acinetobacter terrestris]
MSLMENFKDIYFDFFINNYKENLVKTWVYKDSTYVVDLYFEGFNIAFDLQLINNLFVVDRVVRNYENNTIFQEKKLTLIKSSNTSEIIEFLGGYLAEIRDSVNNLYAYKISVIIPVYNRQNLIGKCIESLNNQNLDKSDFEVIFIDDYSSDKSIEAIETKVSKDINYRILKRPINSGSASAPRNDGILAAKGKYLFFIDSDDYIFEYTLKEMIEIAEYNSSDLVYIKYDGDKGRPWGVRPFLKGNVQSASIGKNHLVRSLMSSKLIRSKILKDNKIFYPLDIIVGEDRVFMISILSSAKKISILGEKPYYYITNHDFGRLTQSGVDLKSDLKIVYLSFRNILHSGKIESEKIVFLSCWFNVVLESYILLRLRSKKISANEKNIYFKKLYRESKDFINLVDIRFIYKELIPVFDAFKKSDFNSCLNLSLSK